MREVLDNIWQIAGQPDNVAVVLMLALVFGFTLMALRLGWRNDRLRATAAAAARPDEEGHEPVVDILCPEEERELPPRVLTWPHLLRLELLVALFVLAFLTVWSIVLDAPLEEPAHPGLSPNPAKAPWYFVGLQDLLVYFDPWIAGVMLPLLIIAGLMALPYLDVNPKGNGYYTLRERKAVIATFLFGFLGLWLLFIVIGTFLRGPGWMWFWPWEPWDALRVVHATNVNLNEWVGGLLGSGWLTTPQGGFWFGALALGGYYVAGALVLRWLLKRWCSETLEALGRVRFVLVATLFLSMLGLPIKVFMRLVFDVKYFWVTPWFNV